MRCCVRKSGRSTIKVQKNLILYLERHVGDARLAEGGHDVDREEGHPADEEDAHDDADRDGRFVVRDVARRRHRGAVQVHRPRHRPDALHVALRVQVQPAVNAYLTTQA